MYLKIRESTWWTGHQGRRTRPRWLRVQIDGPVAVLLAVAAAGCGVKAPDEVETTECLEQERRHCPAPELSEPADGATLKDRQPQLQWKRGRCSAEVTVQLCADAGCTQVQQRIAADSCGSVQPPLELAPGTYYWRASRTCGQLPSPWSPIRRFVIEAPPPPPPPVVTADLFGVWSVAARDVWVVGASGTLLHYDGSWTAEASPTTQTLRAVWATTGGQVLAVGDAGTLLRRSGNTWTAMPSPTAGNLYGVWGSAINDAWAVGADGLILHFDGTAWTIAHNRGAGSLLGIWGSGSRDVWATGSGREPDGDYAALLLHWDGTRWTESYACNPEGTRFASGGWIATLIDVWGTPGGTVWAAGACQPGASFIPFGYVAQKSSGGAWADTPGFGSGEPLGKFRPLRAIWSSGPSDVWAASPSEMVAGAPELPTMLHFNGATWAPSAQAITVGIFDLGGTAAGDVWAVGRGGKRLHFDGGAWVAVP